MTRTLFILPSAIGDVIAGRGVAARLSAEGPVSWIVNELAAPAIADLGCELIHPPAPLARRRASFGAPTEVLRGMAQEFLAKISGAGPFDRVIQVHLTRAAALMAGAARGSGAPPRRWGPALGVPPLLPEAIASDPWSDFLLGSIHHGVSPELPAPARFSLLASLPTTALPEDAPFAPAFTGDAGPILLCPFAGWPSKELSPGQASGIADALADLGPVEILGAPADRDRLAAIATGQKGRRSTLRVGRLADSLEAVQEARLVVTVDSWPLHAAAAANRPTLALLGSTRVFARGERAVSLAPATGATWNPVEDRTIDHIDAATVGAVARALLEESPVDPGVLPDALRVWQGPGLHPLPHRPLPDEPATGTNMLLAWARACGFAAVVKKERPELPALALRPSGHFPALCDNLSAHLTAALAMARCLESSVAASRYQESFILFPTTFPGRDPERVIAAWIKATIGALEAIKK